MDIVSYLLGKGGGGSGGGVDWSYIGYSGLPKSIVDGYNYAKTIYDVWDDSTTSMYNKYSADRKMVLFPLINTSNVTSMQNAFRNNFSLIELPLLDTSNVTNMENAFFGCSALRKIPVFNTGKVTNFYNAFSGAGMLDDESLDNLLVMCINASVYTGTKTLKTLGIQNNINTYPVSRFEALPHYQAFINAGWTVGY